MITAPRPKAAAGRADLLRFLAVADRERLTLDHDRHGWYGYVRIVQENEPVKLEGRDSVAAEVPVHDVSPPATLRLPTLYGILDRQPVAPVVAPQRPVYAPALAPGDCRAAPRESACTVRDEDLIPRARLLPALRVWLATARPGAVDLPRLVGAAARLQTPRHLPRRQTRRWDPDLTVLFDYSPGLWPYRHDMLRLAAWLQAECGHHAFALRICRDGPPGPHWPVPNPGSRLLIVGDLGQLSPPHGPRAWGEFIGRMKRNRVAPLALVPLGAGQLDPELSAVLPQIRWSPDAVLRPQRPAERRTPAGLDTLLAQCAAVRRVDPALLRALRRSNPIAPLNAGLEAAVWCHPDVQAGGAADLNGAAGDGHRARFATLPVGLQRQTDRLRAEHHAHLRRVVEYEETLVLAAHAGVELRTELEPEIEQARAFLGALVGTLDEVPDSPWRPVVSGLLSRVDPAISAISGLAPVLQDLAAACYRPGDGVPDWVEVGRLREGDGPPRPYWLVEDAPSGQVWLSPQPPGPRQSAYGPPLDDARLVLRRDGEPRGRLLALAGGPWSISRGRTEVLHLQTARERLTLGPIRRPLGVRSWGRDGAGLIVDLAPLAGHAVRFAGAELRPCPAADGDPDRRAHLLAGPRTLWERKGCRLSFGLDAPYGAYAELTVRGATQRFRWIMPGCFKMGAPESEQVASIDERPQHEVALSGFWLADTACTQGLWAAVMGWNPSGFQGDPGRPVEQVSWEYCRGFFGRLNALVPGLGAGFPSEAQWEYACRAGTTTAYWFGESIRDGQVNADSKGTVPVASLPANPWGLYEMHGNVWEWCSDKYGRYGMGPETDPEGRSERRGRVLRGGSWVGVAGSARSAVRGVNGPGYRDDGVGFRVAPGRTGPAEPA